MSTGLSLASATRVMLLALLGLAAVFFVLLRPTTLGGPTSYVIVQGPSMEPLLQTGDLVVLRNGAYQVGDVVAFRVPDSEPGEGFLVVHRIVGGSAEDGFVMQGDNKERPDIWRPNAEDIEGRMWFSVPGLGQFVLRLQEPITLGLVAGGLGMLTVLGGGWKSKRRRLPPLPEPPHSIRRPRPRGLGQWLLLILTARLRTALRFTPRHQRGGRHP